MKIKTLLTITTLLLSTPALSVQIGKKSELCKTGVKTPTGYSVTRAVGDSVEVIVCDEHTKVKLLSIMGDNSKLLTWFEKAINSPSSKIKTDSVGRKYILMVTGENAEIRVYGDMVVFVSTK